MKKIKSIAKLLVLLGLGAVLLIWLFQDIEIESLLQQLKQADYLFMAVSVVLLLTAHWVRAFRWKLLISSIHYHPPLGNVFAAVLVGLWANLALPRLGEVSRCGALTKTDNIPTDKLFGTVLMERAVDVLSLLLLAGMVFLWQYDVLAEFLLKHLYQNPEKNGFGMYLTLILVGLFFITAVAGWYLLKKKYKNRWTAFPLIARIHKLLLGLKEGLQSLKYLQNKRTFWISTLLIWFLYWGVTYSMFFVLSSTNELSARAGWAVLAIGSFGMLAPVQGGIGTYHWTVMQALMLYGISKEDSLAYAALSHGAQTASNIIVGTGAFLWVMMRKRKKEI